MSNDAPPFKSLKKISRLYAVHVLWDGEWWLYKSYSHAGHAKNAIMCAKGSIGHHGRYPHRGKIIADARVRIVEVNDNGPVIIWEDMLSNAQRGQW